MEEKEEEEEEKVNEFLPILSTFLDGLECDSVQVISA